MFALIYAKSLTHTIYFLCQIKLCPYVKFTSSLGRSETFLLEKVANSGTYLSFFRRSFTSQTTLPPNKYVCPVFHRSSVSGWPQHQDIIRGFKPFEYTEVLLYYCHACGYEVYISLFPDKEDFKIRLTPKQASFGNESPVIGAKSAVHKSIIRMDYKFQVESTSSLHTDSLTSCSCSCLRYALYSQFLC